jgi:glutamine synthetase adenylyltransferase
MTKEQLIALGLTEEQADKVLGAVVEEMKGYIPKSRFDEVNNANKDLKQQLVDRDKQLEDLKKSAGDNQELQKQIQELQKTNETTTAEYESKLKQVKLDAAVELALTAAKAKNTKAVRALLNLEKAEFDGDQVKGLEDQIKKLKEAEDSKFLFDATDSKPNFKGAKPGEGSDGASKGDKPDTLADAIRSHLTSAQN